MSVFSTPLCKKGGVTSVFKAGALSTLPLFSPFSMLCTLKAQVEAGVNHLNIYTVLAFILLHTYLTSMNGTLLTPFNSYSKQVLLAQLRCKNELCDWSHCISLMRETLLTTHRAWVNVRDRTKATWTISVCQRSILSFSLTCFFVTRSFSGKESRLQGIEGAAVLSCFH